MAPADVIVVSFNSAKELRDCVSPLAGSSDVNVYVVDNASTDGSLDTVRDLDVELIQLERNGGFAYGVNAGWRAGNGAAVLLLNPDARIDLDGIARLEAVLRERPEVGAVAPRIVHTDGTLDFSLRRFPRLVSTYAQALLLHRLFPSAGWTDELVREPEAYAEPRVVDWVSGACVLVRRSALLGADLLDEGFFMYCEDIDLCRRLRDSRFTVRYEPSVVVVHEGGASAPRPSLYPALAASRIRYAQKHRGAIGALVERVGVALGALTHVAVGRGGRAAKIGHARALRVALSPRPPQS
jgi:GT2 family glycosyltransferase